MRDVQPIPDCQLLTAEERSLVQWLLEHGTPAAAAYLAQLPRVRIAARCPCGCASIDFAVDGQRPPAKAGRQILADFVWQDASGNRFGVFVFAVAGLLAGLEVWSVDGLADATTLPAVTELQPLRAGWGT